MATKPAEKKKPQDAPLVKWQMPPEDAAEQIDGMAQVKQFDDFYKFPMGETRVRMLPAPMGSTNQLPIVKIGGHFVKFGAGAFLKANCRRAMLKSACPIDEELEQYQKSNNPADRLIAEEGAAKERYHCNMIIRGQEEKGPQPVEFGWQIYKFFKDRMDKKNYKFCDPTDKGMDVIIKKSKKKGSNDPKNVEYSIYQEEDCFGLPLSKDPAQRDEWLSLKSPEHPGGQRDLAHLCKVLSYDELEKKVQDAKAKLGESTSFDPRRFGGGVQDDIRQIEHVSSVPDSDDEGSELE